MALFPVLRQWLGEQRAVSYPALSLNDYAAQWERFAYAGHDYIVGYGDGYLQQLGRDAYECNGPVAALVAVRAAVFSEIRFMWQALRSGQPQELFGTPALGALEEPWPTAGTGDLLAAMELDASLYGNSYWVPDTAGLIRVDPCHVKIITGDVVDPSGEHPVGLQLLGYGVQRSPTDEPALYLPGELIHYKPPLPDSMMPQFKGRSWLSSVLADANADREMTTYKLNFLRKGAIPGMVINFADGIQPHQFNEWVNVFEAAHSGAQNAGKTLYIGGGADVRVVGQNWEQLNLKAVQGAGETRLAAAAGVPAVVVGFSEGLQGSSLTTGNYNSARRRFADMTVRPLWRQACTALQTATVPPSGSRLWYDDRFVAALQEDVLDDAEIKAKQALAIRTYLDAGFEAESVKRAVITGDLSLLKHSGLFSVQLQPPGTTTTPASSAPALTPATNGA